MAAREAVSWRMTPHRATLQRFWALAFHRFPAIRFTHRSSKPIHSLREQADYGLIVVFLVEIEVFGKERRVSGTNDLLGQMLRVENLVGNEAQA